MKTQPTLKRIAASVNELQKLTPRFGKLEKRVGKLEESVSRVEVRLTNVELDVVEIKATGKRTEEKVDRLITTVDNLVVGKIKTYDSEHAAHRSALSRHEERITVLESRK